MSRIDRIVLIAGVLVLVGSVLTIVVHLGLAYAELERALLSTDAQTGFLLAEIPDEDRRSVVARASDWPEDNLHDFTWLGLLGVFLVGWAARRSGRRSAVPLGLIACSVLLPVAIGLVAGLLSVWRFDGFLDLLTGDALPNDGGCRPMLTPCSHVQALEQVWTATVASTCVLTAVIFVLAARRAFVVGERGTTLPRRGTIGATMLFGLGAVSLIATMPYAADHAREASECNGKWDFSIPNQTSPDLHGVMVERCGADPWGDYRDARGLGGTVIVVAADVQVLRDGSVAMMSVRDPVQPLTPGELAGRAAAEIDDSYPIRRGRGEPLLVDVAITLYIDERTPARAIREHLRSVRAVGVTTLVLLGQTHVEGSLESVGTWTRRNLCPIATVRLDGDAVELGDFDTWGEIITQAIELHPAPLRLQLGMP